MKYIIEIEDNEEQKYVNLISRELMIPKGFGKHEWEGSVNTGIMLTPYKESNTAEQAWKIAQQILKDPNKDGMLNTELNNCFGTDDIYLIGEMSYTEVKARYDAWQKQKDEKIRIGDEVILNDGRRFIVGSILSDGRLCGSGIGHHGVSDSWSNIDPKTVKKGRHFPEVEEAFKKLRESEH